MLNKILDRDVHLTRSVVKCVEALPLMKKLRKHYKMLEISCHAVPWITSILAFIWILNNKNLYQMQVNLLMALILDIIIIAILKAYIRRRRPAVNDDPFSLGPDKYSFPSGHASRSVLIFYFFKYLWPVSDICLLSILIWIFAVILSRLLMRRHYILDISAGIFLGYIEGMLVSILYLESETCSNLIYWITDEKLDGAEYDI
ncbi:polyisoprenoid diphosphate/phosphate phosphohydrolase PLPP6 isoform X2 [Bombus affinis]|nr:polyisoprenoid diphosphate/phosphate phosphohydrolase PLPP6 isoform X2 [Bombus terrestris]XP_048263364.1 polyisoprenoid diphosphate/phosphate phosphohydrolase PLPP6 isoform X2 [Bombus terrestris]XP_048263365.1 polyisoprenoid diphosphate/phosphate phosphohydrolase PLPP6 isoform X2 [Bombus terrestris]XP_050577610.1 polyisoprenoid diphosphate/phosphate phosphohydrolase PLPP6 isoform X2 [Bombus affinis]XP_050577618.1 polyisoprenoid diphosphate/phosphate phosphohydrolase PLPP6 isoform X2 [Bombus 